MSFMGLLGCQAYLPVHYFCMYDTRFRVLGQGRNHVWCGELGEAYLHQMVLRAEWHCCRWVMAALCGCHTLNVLLCYFLGFQELVGGQLNM